MMRIGQQASCSADPLSIVNLELEGAGVYARLGKRHHEGRVDVLLEGNQEWGFVMPPCIFELGYFGRFPLSVSPEDT